MLRVRLLGRLEIDAGVAGVDVPAGRPARLLLGWLAAFPGEHARAEVAARLWPEVLDSSARASLRTALSELRAALGPAAVHVKATRETVALGGLALWVDSREFSELIGAGRWEDALALCRGEVLEGLDEEWVLQARSRHAAERADAAVALVRAATAAGDVRSALTSARRLAAWDPLDETAERELMLALAAAGDSAAALRSHAEFSRRLARELGLAPSMATRELASRLRREQLETAAAAASGPPLPGRLDAVRGGVFAGREASAARLHEAFARTRSGERCLALVTGEPGIGKTRLLAEFADTVQNAEALVLYGRCEEEPATPYQPFAEALAPLAVPDVLVADLGQLAAGRPGEPASDPEVGRARMFDAVAAWLEEMAATRPLVLVLDDLHWADRATLLLMRRLATRPQRVPLLLLGSARDAELGPGHPLMDALAEVRRDRPVVRVALHGLDEAAVATVFEELTGTRPDRGAARLLSERTGGNPFFLRELALHAGKDEAVALPDAVRDVVAVRAGRLPERARRLLELAAVAGAEFDADLMRAGTGEPEETVLDALDDALRAGLLRELPGTEELAFAHALVRDALVGQLSAARRAYLHRRVADALTERANCAPERWLVPLAHHALSGARQDPEPALGYALDAARQAVERLAWEDAVELLERAEELARGRARPARLAEVLVALGDARLRAGETDRARVAFEEAARLAREERRGDLLARAALGVAGLGVTIVAVDKPLVALLEEALERLQPDHASLRVRLLSRLAIALAYAPDEPHRRRLVEEAVTTARELGDAGALAVALTASHVVHWAPEHLTVRLAAADELLALGERTGDPEIELHGRHWRIVDLLEQGHVAAAEDEILLYERVATEARLLPFSWYVPAWRAAVSGYRGEVGAARRLAQEAHAQAMRVRDDNAEPVLRSNHYTLHVVEEAWEEVDLDHLRARMASPAGPSYRAYLALCLAELGDHDAARALLDEAVAEGPERMLRDANLVGGLAQLAEASAAVSHAECAATVVALLEPFADRMVVFVRATALAGSVARPLGRALATAGRIDEAIEALEAAIAADGVRGGIPLAARARRDLAEILLARGARGDGPRAGALLEEAARAADRLGLAEPARRARALRASATAAPPARG
ncbi:MAG TPA: AAA family ATPase [Solirubrobacteraceae bacterium]|nr:AAA family ATPase [Solirubrobacteraceae bacterium]